MPSIRVFTFLLVAASALVAACGQLTPIEDSQACPCAAGYTCCGNVCIAGAECCSGADCCTGSIALGKQAVPAGPDASALPSVQTVTGQSTGTLAPGGLTPFDYAMSVWPKPYGWQLDGWTLNASAGESFTFKLWAAEDAGTAPLSLGLVVYGPLAGLDTGTCSGALVGEGAMTGATVSWSAPASGSYFVSPSHAVTETSSGLAFEGLDDNTYAHAFIQMSATE